MDGRAHRTGWMWMDGWMDGWTGALDWMVDSLDWEDGCLWTGKFGTTFLRFFFSRRIALKLPFFFFSRPASYDPVTGLRGPHHL